VQLRHFLGLVAVPKLCLPELQSSAGAPTAQRYGQEPLLKQTVLDLIAHELLAKFKREGALRAALLPPAPLSPPQLQAEQHSGCGCVGMQQSAAQCPLRMASSCRQCACRLLRWFLP
jgi:hypothetical protein